MNSHSNLALLIPARTAADDAADAALARLYRGESLDMEAAEGLFAALVDGRLEETAIAAMLIALRLKGETTDELIGAARALRAADLDFERPDYLFADSCGTGGDGSGTINVSTAAAFVAAAAGLPVAKHGNRSVTSRCGSADVLERLGARLDISPAESRRALDQTGFCFLFAPQYHPGLRHAGPVRRALKVRTVMNVLGPCVNPAEPPVQLLGVADARLVEPVAHTLAALGTERALIVHGAGLDEIALHGETEAASVRGGAVERMTLAPEAAGLARRPLAELKGGSPEENAERLSALLMGYGLAAETDAVALNAGALLMTAGLAADLAEGVERALDALRSGEARRRLALFVEATHG
ncbi:MAG: anthranilate phosphoribosyltransferase [Alphaproteobacteria bacterium]|nr:anthranilate phosphoribosyltransferase [Alphaproteobacteria bacterium]MBV9370055.1 anthranilate phosphoribosyltransferase [Alphaproteobacteria bacterium]MBV9900729.1 anthranilate phosphoribosyltransferase [Alphaproteobacteria bacterium]